MSIFLLLEAGILRIRSHFALGRTYRRANNLVHSILMVYPLFSYFPGFLPVLLFCLISPGLFLSSDPAIAQERPVFSHESGFYESGINLAFFHNDPDARIFYTTNGDRPDTTSILYQELVPIDDRSSEPNIISMIPTNNGGHPFRAWYEPEGLIRKATVIRAVAEVNGELSPVETRTFFVFDDEHPVFSVPVVSIATDSLGLFGFDEGIYVPGAGYVEGNPHTGNFTNRGVEWERPASIELFEDQNLSLRQEAGIRIHGGFSRTFPQKSLRLYARSDYGENRFYHPVFPDQPYDNYNRLILRNSGNDFGGTMFMDATAQSLVSHLNFDTQAYRPVVVFINGEYWGIHNIRERFDRHYLHRKYGVDENELDLLTNRNEVVEGSDEHYLDFLDYITGHDLSDPAYFEQVGQKMDIDNFLDYYSAQAYFGNNDWPQNNILYWRARLSFNPNAPEGMDGRWRWMMYDVDRSLGYYTQADFDMIEWMTLPENPRVEHEWPNLLLRNLLDNDNFRYAFINRMADQLNSAFTTERVIHFIDSLRAPIEPVIEEHIHRWINHGSVEKWEHQDVEAMYTYAQERPGYLREHIMNHFEIEDTVTLSVSVSDPLAGNVQVNSLDLSKAPGGIHSGNSVWDGTYFSHIPVRLSVRAEEGYRFSHWESDQDIPDLVNPSTPEAELSLSADVHLTAHFVPDDEPEPLQVFYYWKFTTDIPNNEPLQSIQAAQGENHEAALTYQAAISPYPPENLGQTAGILDRVNDPTGINYVPELWNHQPVEDSDMRGIRARNPVLTEAGESSLVFAVPTTGISETDFTFSMAARRTGSGQRSIKLEYITQSGNDSWTSEGLDRSEFMLYEAWKQVSVSLSGVSEVADNPDLRFRIRFTGDENYRTGNNGNARFNNVMLHKTTEIPQLPEQVMLISPENDEQAVSPDYSVFRWSPAEGGEYYQVQISTDMDFSSLVLDAVHTPSEIEPGRRTTVLIEYPVIDILEPYTLHHWRVRALNDAGPSPWSQPFTFETTGTLSGELETPERIVLKQNYPNPFNPTTQIEFVLSDAAPITLEVYTLHGRKAATLVDEVLSPGRYSVTFDGSGLSSGVYMYRIVSGSFKEVRKMILIK